MITRHISTVAALLSGLASAACGSSGHGGDAAQAEAGLPEAGSYGGTGPCGPSTIAAGTFHMTYKGVNYGYIVHLPPSYDGTKRTPLVLNWHGLTSNASQQETFSSMDSVADSAGFILVYPDSPDAAWNAGACCASLATPDDSGVPATSRDDVGFARALVQQISSEACVDAKRIYTTGMSNGGFMTYQLGCQASDVFAAIAPVAGKVGIPDCNPTRSVPVMAFHGTADPLVSYDAGTLSGENLDVPGTVKRWADRDGCQKGPDVTYQQGTVTCQTWSECDAGATVTLCSADGEGHCWPGQSFCPYGQSTTDVNASQQIADFFHKFSMP